MIKTTVVGLDVGRSATKVVAAHNGVFTRFIFPSIVAPAIDIAIKEVAERAELETVTVAGKSYFTGETASVQGRVNMSLGLSDDWTDTTPYLVLVASAMKRLAQRGVPGLEAPYVVTGTPSKLFRSHREALARRTLEVVSAETVKVLPQPMGAFSSFAMDHRGMTIKERHRDAGGAPLSWAVIEVGHFTTDFLLMRKGVYVEAGSISCEGIHVAVDDLVRRLAAKGFKINHIEAEEILRTKAIKHFGKIHDVSAEVDLAIDTIASTIQISANTLLAEEARRLDGVLLAGGGGAFILEAMKKQWPNTRLVDDPRMSVADGYCRFGVGAVAKRAIGTLEAARV